jgi:hypothetical protein
MAKDERMIAALLREREGYERRGLDDRVRQVDEQLAHHGHKSKPDEDAGPQGRTAPPQKTAEGGKPTARKGAAKKTAASKPPEETPEPEPAPEHTPAE